MNSVLTFLCINFFVKVESASLSWPLQIPLWQDVTNDNQEIVRRRLLHKVQSILGNSISPLQ